MGTEIKNMVYLQPDRVDRALRVLVAAYEDGVKRLGQQEVDAKPPMRTAVEALIRHLDAEATEATLARMSNTTTEPEQVMFRLAGVPFECECGGNVFHPIGDRRYRCDSCLQTFEGRP